MSNIHILVILKSPVVHFLLVSICRHLRLFRNVMMQQKMSVRRRRHKFFFGYSSLRLFRKLMQHQKSLLTSPSWVSLYNSVAMSWVYLQIIVPSPQMSDWRHIFRKNKKVPALVAHYFFEFDYKCQCGISIDETSTSIIHLIYCIWFIGHLKIVRYRLT